MTPSARIQGSIELLGNILTSWQSPKRIPADKLIDNYFRARRFIGSKDRAAIGELVYWVLRNKSALEWHVFNTIGNSLMNDGMARALVFSALILRKEHTKSSIQGLTQQGDYAPARLNIEEEKLCSLMESSTLENPDMPQHVRLNYPEWLESELKTTFGDKMEQALQALASQAPTDLRVNTLKTTREELSNNLMIEGFENIPTPLSEIGIRLKKRAPIFTSEYFKKGHFEVQDEGSQMVAELVGATSQMKVIDFCAGAGGKTLAIAAQMKNKGRILAWDTSAKRLTQIKERLKRAGVDNVQIHVIESENDAFIKRHKQSAERVLVDAPCSGTGTWRRNPDLKWRFTQKDLDEVTALQQTILESASRLVAPGGRLIYATCSLLKTENDLQVEKFIKNNGNFRVVCAEKIWNKSTSISDGAKPSYLWVTPHQDGVDGFFAAVLERLPNTKQE